MNQGLLWLADNLRVSYGETALLCLARMILRVFRSTGCAQWIRKCRSFDLFAAACSFSGRAVIR